MRNFDFDSIDWENLPTLILNLAVVLSIAFLVYKSITTNDVSFKMKVTSCVEKYYETTTIQGTVWQCDDVVGRNAYGCVSEVDLINKKDFKNLSGISVEEKERKKRPCSLDTEQ